MFLAAFLGTIVLVVGAGGYWFGYQDGFSDGRRWP